MSLPLWSWFFSLLLLLCKIAYHNNQAYETGYVICQSPLLLSRPRSQISLNSRKKCNVFVTPIIILSSSVAAVAAAAGVEAVDDSEMDSRLEFDPPFSPVSLSLSVTTKEVRLRQKRNREAFFYAWAVAWPADRI